MADNVTVTITKTVKQVKGKDIENTHIFAGRLIGLADFKSVQAILNTKGSGRKLFSSEAMSLDEATKLYSVRDRIVIATTYYSKDKKRVVYISPPIKYVSWDAGKRAFKCADETCVLLEEV